MPGQQKFPLRPGEWESTTKNSAAGGKDQAMTSLFCLNDEHWEKALNQNPSCKLQILNATSSGSTYTFDCPAKSFQVNGKVDLTYDGMQHMVGKGSIQMTVNGTTSNSESVSDWRWKNATCGPNDMNMRPALSHTSH
jgi:hypothetical protein